MLATKKQQKIANVSKETRHQNDCSSQKWWPEWFLRSLDRYTNTIPYYPILHGWLTAWRKIKRFSGTTLSHFAKSVSTESSRYCFVHWFAWGMIWGPIDKLMGWKHLAKPVELGSIVYHKSFSNTSYIAGGGRIASRTWQILGQLFNGLQNRSESAMTLRCQDLLFVDPLLRRSGFIFDENSRLCSLVRQKNCQIPFHGCYSMVEFITIKLVNLVYRWWTKSCTSYIW